MMPDLPDEEAFWGSGYTWACPDVPTVSVHSFIDMGQQRCGR